MVRYQASEMSGDFLDETATPSQAAEMTKSTHCLVGLDPNDPFTANLEVDIHDDDIRESTGQIKVTLLSDTEDPVNYIVASNGTQEAIGTIYDDDAPELSITAKTPNVTESGNTSAIFEISAKVSPNKQVSIKYDLIESGNFITGEGTDLTLQNLDFSSNKTEATHSITLTSDSTPEDDGTITMTPKSRHVRSN